MRPFVEYHLTDHQFAEILRRKGWTGAYQSNPPTPDGIATTAFLHPDGDVLANVVYNNRACTRRIFMEQRT